jgi:hypothetical protein
MSLNVLSTQPKGSREPPQIIMISAVFHGHCSLDNPVFYGAQPPSGEQRFCGIIYNFCSKKYRKNHKNKKVI